MLNSWEVAKLGVDKKLVVDKKLGSQTSIMITFDSVCFIFHEILFLRLKPYRKIKRILSQSMLKDCFLNYFILFRLNKARVLF